MNAEQPARERKLRMAIIGGGRRCLTALELLDASLLQRLQAEVVGVADINPAADGITRARQRGIFTTDDCTALFDLDHVDLVIELTDDRQLLDDLAASKPDSVSVIGQAASRLFHDIISIYQELENKRDEVSLSRSYAQAMLEATSEGVMVLDRDFRILRVNQAALASAGLTRQEALGKYCFQVSHQSLSPCDCPDHPCPMKITIETGKSAHAIHEHSQPDGVNHYCDVSTYPLFNRQGEVVQVLELFRDITHDLHQRMEQRTQAIKDDLAMLVKEDKLISLGKLVASVAHEINNPIASILNFAKLMNKSLRAGKQRAKDIAEYQRYLGLCVSEGERCAKIVRNLLSFARQSASTPRRVDVVELLASTALLTSHRMKLSNIDLAMDVPGRGLEVWGDPSQLQQVFTNLVFNAIEAMPAGGRLNIIGSLDQAARVVRLSFSDSGEGIAPENIPHIFEPFFSTKQVGYGVGLGLSMVYGIVRDHNGAISVESRPGAGATFKVELPWSPLAAGPDAGARP